MGKERIEFALHSAAHAGEEKSDQMGEGQLAFAREIPRFLPSRLEKGRASNEVSQPGKYVDIFRPSYLTYKYQSVKNRNHIRNGPSLAIASKYAEVLSHEDWISTTLAGAGLNIHNMVNKSRGDLAFTRVDVECAVPQAVIDQLTAIGGVLRVRYLPS